MKLTTRAIASTGTSYLGRLIIDGDGDRGGHYQSINRISLSPISPLSHAQWHDSQIIV